MNKQRQIRLTPEEQAAFLQEGHKAALATLDKDGFPHLVAMGFMAKDGVIYMTSYGKAQKVRSLIERDFRHAFASCDVIVTPTAPTPAFKLGEKADGPLAMYLSDIYTITANLAGVPGISLPCGLSSTGLPIGVQLIGRHFDEARLLCAAHNLEKALGVNSRPPTLRKD